MNIMRRYQQVMSAFQIQVTRAPLEELRTGYHCILCGRELIYTHHMSEREIQQRIERYEDYMVHEEGDIEALNYVYIWGCVEHGACHEHCEVNFHIERDDDMPTLTNDPHYHPIPK